MNSETSAALATAALAALGLFVLMLIATSPAPGAVCLTKAQARELWPKQHLYWYSPKRCWSNRRGPPQNLQIDPIPNTKTNTTPWVEQAQAQAPDAKATPKEAPKHKKRPRRKPDEARTYRWEEFNPLDALADRGTYFYGEPIETWASIMPLNLYQFTPWNERISGALR